MTSRTLRWYVGFSFILLLALIAVFVVRIQRVRTTNYEQAEERFSDISERLFAAWDELDDGETPDTVRFDARFRRDPALQLVSVYSYRYGIDYLWARDPAAVGSFSRVPGSVPAIGYDELTQVQFTRGIDEAEGTRIVTAVYTLIDGTSVFPILRDTLIAILVFTLFAIVIAVFHAADQKKSASGGTNEVTESEEATPAVTTQALTTPSGLSHESLLTRRLSLELDRSAFNEQDFSMAILEFTRGERYDDTFLRIAETFLEFYTFEDLCFEYDENRIVVLFPSSTLRETLTTVERFQRHLWQERKEWTHPDVDLLAGVSSRNGRLVDGSRILHETEVALRRAYDAPGHVVGFEPDPEKYRDYILAES